MLFECLNAWSNFLFCNKNHTAHCTHTHNNPNQQKVQRRVDMSCSLRNAFFAERPCA